MSFRSGEESEAGMAPFIIILIVAMVITLIVALRITLFVTLLGTLFATLIVTLTYGNPSSDPFSTPSPRPLGKLLDAGLAKLLCSISPSHKSKDIARGTVGSLFFCCRGRT